MSPFFNLGAVVLVGLSGSVEALLMRDTVPNSNLTTIPAQFFPKLNSSKVKIRYGPYDTPINTKNNGMGDFEEDNATQPCSDCTITWMQAGLEYPNGSYANANSSIWLHHTFMANMNAADLVCPTYPQRFFASGNERSPADLSINGTNKAGYYIGPNDTFSIVTELMNMLPTIQKVVVTMEFEYVPGNPAGFSKISPVWLDVTNCNGSYVPAKPGTFQYSMTPGWNSTISGRITSSIPHLHDGGVNLQLLNGKDVVCDSKAVYGGPGYVDSDSTMAMSMSMAPSSTKASVSMPSPSAMPMSMGNDTTHISYIRGCTTGQVSKGEEWSVTAYYNGNEHGLMLNMDGSLAPVMGISMMYVAEDEVSPKATTTASAGAASATAASAAQSGMKSGSLLSLGGILLGVAAFV